MSDHIEQADVVIVGGGPAGLTSALYAARAGLTPVCLEGYDSGGQMSRAVVVENFPGLPPEGVSGAELTDGIRNQAVHHGARIVTDEVIAIDRDADERFAVRTAGGTIRARAVIMATGSAARELGVPGEEEYVGRGVAYCAICDGAFFAGKRVTVVGGGDAAVGEALALRKVAAEVTLIHRRSTLRAGTASRSALERSDVHVRTPFIVEEIVGDEQLGVTGLKLRNLDEGCDDVPRHRRRLRVHRAQPGQPARRRLGGSGPRGLHRHAARLDGDAHAGRLRRRRRRRPPLPAGDHGRRQRRRRRDRRRALAARRGTCASAELPTSSAAGERSPTRPRRHLLHHR